MVTLQLDPTIVSKLKKCTELSDVVVKYGDKEYHLHKFILSATSQYFYAAFTNWSNDTIDLSQVPFDIDVLEALFDIIYGSFEFDRIGKYVEAGLSIGMLKKALDFFMMTSHETLLYDGILGYFKDVLNDPEKMMSLIVSVADLLSLEWKNSTMLYFKSYLRAHWKIQKCSYSVNHFVIPISVSPRDILLHMARR
ncbi:hypothetical protein BKA69DRAFT_210275 [Paraphysoderma sedebokerense]|nr:hypothetical protein BKA69DRAFT_210275 [Paraphysoderma sedebokerense]